MTAADKYIWQVREGTPVAYNGLQFHALTVRKYGLYLQAKPAFELMQGSLKLPKFARLPWCACLWALDEEFRVQTGTPGRFLIDVLTVMAEALRLGAYTDAGNGGKLSYPIRPIFSQGNLTAIMVGNPGQHVLLDMKQMSDVREIIAAQNGYEIPDENWNPELVKASQENANRGSIGLDVNFETLIFSVAFQCGCRSSEIYDWTIREFQGMQDAIDRSLNFQICSLAERSGNVKYKNGNPYPTWKYDRKNDMPAGFKTIAEIDAGAKGLIKGV